MLQSALLIVSLEESSQRWRQSYDDDGNHDGDDDHDHDDVVDYDVDDVDIELRRVIS